MKGHSKLHSHISMTTFVNARRTKLLNVNFVTCSGLKNRAHAKLIFHVHFTKSPKHDIYLKLFCSWIS